MNLFIPTNVLAAIAVFQPQKPDERKYLNGVYLETGRTGERLVATDSNILGIHRLNTNGPLPETSIIIPKSLIDHVRPGKNAPPVVGIEFDERADSPRRITMRIRDEEFSAPEIEGNYPNYRRIFPDNLSGEIAQFDPNLLSRVYLAIQILYGKKSFWPGIFHNGNGPALVQPNDMFAALVMPYRLDSIEPSAHTWVKQAC